MATRIYSGRTIRGQGIVTPQCFLNELCVRCAQHVTQTSSILFILDEERHHISDYVGKTIDPVWLCPNVSDQL
jgi:hypothetical protein